MFDIGFWEIAVIATIMLVVLGPERLPGVARTAGFWLSKIRRMVSDVKTEVKKEMDAAELKELNDAKNQIQEASKKVQTQLNKNIVNDEPKSEDSSSEDSPEQPVQEQSTNDKTDSSANVKDESGKP